MPDLSAIFHPGTRRFHPGTAGPGVATPLLLTGLNMVELASLVVDMQARSCMLKQTVHGLMNEQT